VPEARAWHAHKAWTEVSSPVPHFLQMGLSLSPITYKCHLRVLCPVRRPMTILDCVLLKDNNHAIVAKSGLEINSRACLCVLQGPCHITKCWLSIQRLIFFLYSALRPPKKGSMIQQTVEKNRPLRACRRFHFLALRNGQRESCIRFQAGARGFSLLLSLSRQALGPTLPV
jgi:hypothetical protein